MDIGISKQAINVIFLSLISLSTYGSIGTITEHSNEPATISRSNTKLQGIKGSNIEMNDTVITDKSNIGITFDDDTKVNITENSKLVIDDFVYEPKKGAGKLGLKVAIGTVRYTSGIIAHNNPNAVNIHTPTATIAVRGTDFLMSVDEIGRSLIILLPQCDKKKDEMICFTGIIDVSTSGGVVTLNQANQATLVNSSENPPTPPVILKLDGRPLNNSLQLSPPITLSGVSITQIAKVEDGENSEANEFENNGSGEEQFAIKFNDTQELNTFANSVTIEQVNSNKQQSFIANQKVKQEQETKMVPFYENQIQSAWQYKGISDAHTHYSNILLPMESNAKLIVMQDLVSDGIVLGTGVSGSIVIRQLIK